MSGQPTLGRILRDLRNHRGWTLKEMSERSGIPVSTLSKVEHDRLTLTYDKLQLLSQKLNIRMSELFAESDPSDEGITARRSIGRQDDAVRVTTPNYDYYYLCTELRRKRMIPILTRIRAKSLSEFGDLVRAHENVLEALLSTAGNRDDVADLYGIMDVLAHPSHREGFPRAPMEASATPGAGPWGMPRGWNVSAPGSMPRRHG